MKKTKAILAFALAISMCVSTACGRVDDGGEKLDTENETTAAESEEDAYVTTTVKSSVSNLDSSENTAQEQTKQQSTSAATNSPYSTTTKKSAETTRREQNVTTQITAAPPQTVTAPQMPQTEPQPTPTQEPEVTTQHRQTTTAPQKPVTTTQKPQTTTKQTTTQKPSTTQPQETVEWSESMKTWRKLCEGNNLSQREQDIIRSEILEYAEKFNGQKDIHVSFGIDEFDISYEKPLNMVVREDMTDPKLNAHMDACAYAADYLWLIEYAKSEEEIYDLVSEAREDCLHVIDHGLFNRYEIFTINDSLEYASDIVFNIGFDEDMYIWFLTDD